MPTLGYSDLAADVIPRLAEEVDGGLLVETSTRRRVTAEASMFRYQGVCAVIVSACSQEWRGGQEEESTQQTDASTWRQG